MIVFLAFSYAPDSPSTWFLTNSTNFAIRYYHWLWKGYWLQGHTTTTRLLWCLSIHRVHAWLASKRIHCWTLNSISLLLRLLIVSLRLSLLIIRLLLTRITALSPTLWGLRVAIRHTSSLGVATIGPSSCSWRVACIWIRVGIVIERILLTAWNTT